MKVQLVIFVLFCTNISIFSQIVQNQFILFDVLFAYTKQDADNSRPSKSHFYVKDSLINKSRPQNWISPFNFRNGSVHIRLEVLDKPEGNAPTTWTLCYIPNKGQGNGYGCTGTPVFIDKGIYEKEVDMTSFWQNEAILWEFGIKQMDLVIKDDSGGQGHAHNRSDFEKFFPTRIRISMVQVAKGSTYDPIMLKNNNPIQVN